MSIRLVKTRGNLLKYNIKSKDFLFFIFLKKKLEERGKKGVRVECGFPQARAWEGVIEIRIGLMVRLITDDGAVNDFRCRRMRLRTANRLSLYLYIIY
jgi:hypothetical protein